MKDNKPIDKWTQQECEEYLNKWPKSLNSYAVRQRLSSLTAKDTNVITEIKKTPNVSNVADIVESVKIAERKESIKKNKDTTINHPKPITSSNNKDNEGFVILGKIVLSILVVAASTGLALLIREIRNTNNSGITGIICYGMCVPLLSKIWKN